jgi:hypothetical protein
MAESPWVMVSEGDNEISDEDIVDLGSSEQIVSDIERHNTANVYSVWISLVRRNPSSSPLQEQLAKAIEEQGNDRDAIIVWHDLVQKCPDVPELRARLAAAYEKISAYGSAAVIWKTLDNHWTGAWEWRARFSMRQRNKGMLMQDFVQDRMNQGKQKATNTKPDNHLEDSTFDTRLEQLTFCRDMFDTWFTAKGDHEPNAQVHPSGNYTDEI